MVAISDDCRPFIRSYGDCGRKVIREIVINGMRQLDFFASSLQKRLKEEHVQWAAPSGLEP